ncbi:hypothetical protein [Leptolyngbya sp. FACHB-16]|uniref:hypothetical protein n=1 Tax=unclassified Leptolyngbya TaxID=2650499 RepID=UPI001681DF37|nr:hypothetical protein [Leptolyngbya sp. FACHB-16]MBD2156243.1 hypothetical protein [Leptolyngbya sp. FACHB-16]
MAVSDVTFADPLGIIATVSFSPLRDGGYGRVWNQAAFVDGENQAGKDIIRARAIGSKYTWSIGGRVTAARLSDLDELIAKQDSELSDGTPYLIRFTDEVRKVFPFPAPHPKLIVSGSVVKGSGATEGYARFNVKVTTGDSHGEYVGPAPEGDLHIVDLTVQEIL